MVKAYSYIRFSSRKQMEGDSLRRQTEKAEAYCKRWGWELDTTLTLRDLGVPAFRGQNALVGNFAVFLKSVEEGRVAPDSALIVGSFDRISRQGIDEGYDLVKRILKAGIKIVTLSPERQFDREATRSLSKGALEIQLILERAAEESELKSKRIAEAWAERRKQARDGAILTRQLPAWIEEHNGKLRLIPERVAVVKKIFRLAGSGYGRVYILQKLEAEKDPVFGYSGQWSPAYIGKILHDRRVLGELQFQVIGKDGKRKPEGGPPIMAYPAVVTETEWLKAQAGRAERRRKGGRPCDTKVNIFAGLVHSALDGSTYIAKTKRGMLMNMSAVEGRDRYRNFPLEVFEQAIRDKLRELDYRDVFPPTEPLRTKELEAMLAGIEREIAELASELDEGISPTLLKAVKKREARKAEIEKELEEARQQEASPRSEAWRELKLETHDDRLRLRSALRLLIEDIMLLVIDRKMALVQIWFAKYVDHRNYLLLDGEVYAKRWKQGDIDLRDQEIARSVEEAIKNKSYQWLIEEWL